jgi:hypothetical protein
VAFIVTDGGDDRAAKMVSHVNYTVETIAVSLARAERFGDDPRNYRDRIECAAAVDALLIGLRSMINLFDRYLVRVRVARARTAARQ